MICTNCHEVEASVCVTCAQQEVDGLRARIDSGDKAHLETIAERDRLRAPVEADRDRLAAEVERLRAALAEAHVSADYLNGVADQRDRLRAVLAETPENVERVSQYIPITDSTPDPEQQARYILAAQRARAGMGLTA